MLHNETINVWSHLIGVGLFLGLLLWTGVCLSPISSYVQVPDSLATSAQFIWSSGEATYMDFEDLCDRYLNISLKTTADDAISLTEQEAFLLWSKALK